MRPDIEYKNAIRYYIDYILNSLEDAIDSTDDIIELNVVKPLTGYIVKKAPAGFQFATPMFAWWDLTSACNFRCIHCLYNDTAYDASHDLSDDEALNLADSLINDFGIVQIVLTGGEIFLRPKLLMRLIEKFKSNNVGVALATNASLINQEHIDFLSKTLNAYTDRLQISLDGSTYETFKKIRQTDTFPKIVKNIELLAGNGLRITAVCTVNRINYHEVLDTYSLCDKIGVYDFAAGRMLVFNESHKNLCVTDRDYMLLAQKLIEAKKDKKTLLKAGLFSNLQLLNIDGVEEILKEDKYRDILKSMTALPSRSCNRNDRISIRSDGSVYMCMDAQCPSALMGNVRKQSLPQIWGNRRSNIFFQPRLIENMGCRNCDYKNICNSGCMAKAYKRTGRIDTPEIACKYCL